MRRTLFSVALLLCICIAAGAQRKDVRNEVLADWNLSSGLDCVIDLSVKPATPAPKGYKAVYVSHYGRHGSRYAYTDKAYKVILDMLSEAQDKDNLTPRGEALLEELLPFWDFVHYRVGDLTTLGWEQHRQIASIMVKSYPAAFRSGSLVDACSSSSPRAIMSMSSCCAAISRLAPKTEVYEHQSVMDIPATRPNRNNPFVYSGPSRPFPYDETMETFFSRHFPEYEDVLARLFKDPKAAMAGRNPGETFFYLYMFVGGMNSLPEQERLHLDGFFTREEYAKLWEVMNFAAFKEYYNYLTPCSSIVDDIVDKADARIASRKPGADLRYGHDHVFMTLLMIMDIDGFGHVPASSDSLAYWFQDFRSPMGANMQFVFYSPKNGKGDYLVKLLLNGEEAALGDLKSVQGPYYKWEDARAYLRGRVEKFAYRP